MSLNEQFEAAAANAKGLPNQSNETLLQIYALYKQGSAGDVQGDRPSGFNFKGQAKYDAWAKLQGKSQDDAKQEYVDLIKSLAQ